MLRENTPACEDFFSRFEGLEDLMRKCFGLVCSLLFAVAGCDDSPPVTGPDPGPGPSIPGFYTLQKLSGDGQTGSPGVPLTNPYVIKVVDSFGGAVPGATVVFRIDANAGGSLSASTVTTDSSGDASVTARLPDAPDVSQTVVVQMDSSTNTVSFTSQTTLAAGGPSNIRIVSGDGQKGTTGDTLPDPLVVEVTDAEGIALAGVSVKWQVVSVNGGSVTASPTLTDSLGIASNRWRLGSQPGVSDRVIAWIEPSIADPDTVTFTAEVTPGPSSIRIISGDGQKGITRDTLLDPLVVEVTDPEGIALPGVSVKWSVISGENGSVRETPTTTDGQGLSFNRWRVGNLQGATDTVIAWIEPLNADPDTVMFVADVTGVPDTIVIVQGAVELDHVYNSPEEIIGDTVFVEIGHWARYAFKGIVKDADGRTVRGAILTWTVTDSGGWVGLEPEDGAGEEAVTLNTAEDGGITVWRKDGGGNPAGKWIGATLSIEKYPDVVPITLDAFVGNSVP